MPNKYIEFQEKVKFILDKSDVKKDVQEFAEEVQGVFENVKVGFDAKSLKQLGDLFNEKLKELGKQPIVFSDIEITDGALKEITTRFTKAIGDSIRAGIQDGMSKAGKVGAIDFGIEEQLKQLKADRKKLVDEYRKTEKEISGKTNIDKINNRSHGGKKLTLTGDLNKHTDEFIQGFNSSIQKMKAAEKGTSEYRDAVIEAQNALDGLVSLQGEWDKKQDELSKKRERYKKLMWKKQTPEVIEESNALESDIKQLESLNITRQISRLKKIKLSDDADLVSAAFGDISSNIDGAIDRLNKIRDQIAEIDKQIQHLGGNSRTLKSLEEIEKAYDRILNKKSKTVNKTKKENIESALGYGATTERMTLAKLAHGYEKSSLNGEDWESQYVWLVKFVKEYDNYVAQNKDINPQYKQLYDRLKPMAAGAESSLTNLLTRVNGTEDAGSNAEIVDSDAARKSAQETEKVADALSQARKEAEAETAAQRASREETNAKLKLEKEILETKKEAVENERLLSKLSSTSNVEKEKFAYLNTDNGYVSQHIVGEYGQVSKEAQKELLRQVDEEVNATLHTHPDFVAAPSEDDILNFANNHHLFTKNFILAGEQLAEVDFTGLSQTQAKELAEVYKKNILNAEDQLDEKFNHTKFAQLGIESLDIEGILSKASEHLMSKFPELQADIDKYVQDLGAMFKNVSIGDITQDKLESMIEDVTGSNFNTSSIDVKSDIYQIAQDAVNSVSGIPSMYQEELKEIFLKTIRDLKFDPSKIFKLHNVNDFDSKLFTMRNDAQQNAQRIEHAESSFNKLDDLSDSAYEITDAEKLNDIIKQRKDILDSIHESVRPEYADEIAAQQQINEELEKRVALLRDAKNGIIDVDDIDNILQENGTLESKLERLDDVSYDWGMKIKDGEEDDAIDELEAFEETYDRIILKLANGKKIEILPNAKGLRALNKYQDGLDHSAYGETEIDDVIFERKKKEFAVQEQLNDAVKEQQNIEQSNANESVDKLQEKLQKIKEFNALKDKNYLDADVPTSSEPEKEIERLTKIKELYSEITGDMGELVKSPIHSLENAIMSAQDAAQMMKLADVDEDALYTKISGSSDDFNTFLGEINGRIPWEEDIEDQIDSIIKPAQQAEIAVDKLNESIEESKKIDRQRDTVVVDNQNKIESYEELCTIVKQYNALALKRFAGKNTPEDDVAFNELEDRINNTRGLDLNNLWGESIAWENTFDKLSGVTTVERLAHYLRIKIPKAADEAAKSVDGLNTSLEKQRQIEQADASSTQSEETKAETTAVEQQNEALKENIGLKQMVENASRNGVPGQSVAEAAGTTVSESVGVGADKQDLSSILSNITYKVQIVQNHNVPDSDKKAALIDIDALKQALGTITYNTKIVTDDADNTANKIALDDATLEATLNRVFASIIHPTAQQNDGSVQEPWALESTLQSVKGVLDTIQTNTSRIGTSEVTTIADDGVLSAIKTAVESINKKIVQGTKVINTGSKKKTEEKSDKIDIKNPKELGNVKATKVDQRVESLYALYEQRGELLAENSVKNSNVNTEEINQLNKKIQLKFKELNLEDEKRKSLKQSLMARQEEVKQSKMALLIAKQTDDALKQAAKDEKAQVKEMMRRNREENRVNSAKSAWSSGQKVMESLWKIDSKEDPLKLPQVETLSGALKSIYADINNINDAIKNGRKFNDDDKEIKALKQKTALINKQSAEIKRLIANYAELSDDNPNIQNTNSVVDPTANLKQQLVSAAQQLHGYSVKIGDYNAETGRLKYTVKSAANEFEEYEMAVREVGGAIVSIHTGTKKTERFIDTFNRKIKEISSYFSAATMIYKAFNMLRQGVQYIREIDSALTELKKVTSETEETYNQFLKTAAKTADRVGSTIKDVVSSTADFSRLGYSLKDAAEMAEAAQVLMNVSEFTDISTATDTLISAVKAFGYTAQESMHVVDILNVVGNNYAISTSDLAQSLTRSSAALVAAGNSMEQAAALTVAGNTILQDPESVGNALKVVSMRLRGTASELEAAGEETDGLIESTSKLQSKIKGLTGVDILQGDGSYKDTYTILYEIGQVWDNLSDLTQADVLESIAGKTRGSAVAAILQNYELLEEAYNTSLSADGSAQRELAKYLDSFEGRMSQLTNAAQTAWSKALNTDAIKDVIQLLTKFINTIDFEDNGILKIIERLTEFLSWTMDIFGGGNAGYTIIAFFGAKMLNDHGWFGFLDRLKKTGGETIETLASDINKLNSEIKSLTELSTKQSGKAQQKTLQKIDAKTKLRDIKQKDLDALEKNRKAQVEAMMFSDKEKEQIAENFDIDAAKRSISSKKGAISKRANQLQKDGQTFAQIQEDPKIKQWNNDIAQAEQKIEQYNQAVNEADASLTKANETIQASSGAIAEQSGAQAVNNAATSVNSQQQTNNSGAQAINEGARRTNDGAIDEQNADIATQNGLLDANSTKQVKNAGATKTNAAGFKELGKGLMQSLAYTALLQGAMQILDGIMWGVEEAINAIWPKGKSFEELNEAFEEASSDLREEQTELKNIESELEDVESRIKEIESLGKLSFTSQEELDNLKKQREELERQAEIQKILTKTQQKTTNAKSVAAAKAYMRQSAETDKTLSEAAEKTKETGEKVGSIVDGALMIGGAVVMIATGWTGAGAVAGGAMMAAGMAGVGNKVGGAIGESVGESNYKKQQTNQKAIENYKSTKDDYQNRLNNAWERGDAEEYDKIQEEYDKFEAMMSERISGLLTYINDMDYDALDTDGKKFYDSMMRLIDVYNLANDGSITSVVNNLLNSRKYEKTGYDVRQIQKQFKNGDITEEQAREFIGDLLRSSPGLSQDFTDRGLDIEKVIDSYVQDVVDAINDSSVIDSIDKISAVTNAFDGLGDAVKEFREEGKASVGTLEELNEIFGSVDGFEDLYKVLATGEGDLESAVTNVANAYVGQAGILTDMTDAELDIMESRLAAIGVLNAEEVLMARQTGQERINALGLAYSIDLSNYGTAEQAKVAMANAAGLNIAEIQGDTIEALEKAYGMDLSAYASVEEAKIAIAMERAKAEANANRAELDRDYKNKSISYDEYMQGLDDIDNSLDFTSRYGVIEDIINNAYSNFKFDFDNQIGIGSDFDEHWGKDKASEAFQKSMDYWENRIAANQAKYEQIQNEVDLLEAKGMRAGAEYYRNQIDLEKERKSLLEQQKAEALKYLGTLKEGSDEWWEVASTINSIEGEIDDVTASVHELNDAIGQIRWDNFEEVHDRLSNLTTDLENIRDVLSSEDMFDDEGNFTKEGVANLATYIQALEIYKNALVDVQEELVDFQQGYAGNEDYFETIGIDSEQEYYDKLLELTDAQDDYVKQIKESEKSVVEMYENQIDAVEEYIGELIDGYNDYIDVVKESLDAERDLYNFKKSTAEKTKNIAALERRIAALSGSNNAADIATRRKLQAELMDAKSDLDDHYYQNAKDQQAQALDDEAQAYEESMNKYIEGLRTMLDEATKDMTTFLTSVTNVVVQNAGNVEDAYNSTGLALDSAVIAPWAEAAKAMAGYEEGALARMNEWTQAGENGYFYNFNANATEQLKSPWSAGTNAANTFASSVKSAMNEVYTSVKTNVDSSLTKLNSLTDGIQDTDSKADSSSQNKTTTTTTDKVSTSGLTDSKGGAINTDVERLQAILNKFFGANLTIDGLYGPATTTAVKKMQAKIGDITDGLYTTVTFTKLKNYFNNLGGSVSSWFKSTGVYIPGGIKKRSTGGGSGTTTVHLNAKGTLGTKQDGWNITDESWIGEEITLAAGKNGQLQYLKKGSAVLPADISANLVEWGKINPDMIKIGGGANINMISNAVNKPEIKLDIAEFLHVDNVAQDTLPALEKFVDQKMNDLIRQLNYSIKKFK